MRRSTASRYIVRRQALAAMGFECYKHYLASEIWKTIKARIFERDENLCRACNKPARVVHHITYDITVMQGLDDSQLVAICHGCHQAVEFDYSKKLTYTTAIFSKLMRRMKLNRSNRPGKAKNRSIRPRCRCCQRQYRKLGRDDICMGCYKSGRVMAFRQTEAAQTASV